MTKSLFPRFPRFPRLRLPKTVVVPCPKCGKENTLAFSEIEKHIKPGTPLVVACGCSFSPKEALHQLQHELIRRRGIEPPDPSE